MIKSIHPVITTTMLIGGSFLILSMPIWMTYVALASMSLAVAIHWAYKNNEKMSLIWHFCAEFIGFCLFVALFVGTTVMMHELLAT